MIDLRCSLFLVICWLQSLPCSSNGAEHKVPYVQNIVLYPDKHSWCRTTEIKQIVAYPGCNSVEIDNNVCVGACFSYSIPKTLPSAPGEVITPYCDSCQPSAFTWKEVKLTCHDESNEYEDAMVELTKKVQVIENCTCTTCTELKVDQTDHQRLAENVKSDVPELLDILKLHKNDEDDVEEETSPTITESKIHEDLDNVIDDEIDDVALNDNESKTTVHSQKGTHLELGPHHSLVIIPDVLPVHHQEAAVRHHKIRDDEKVPSLLRNQFKIHDHEEYLDQIAVESQKELATKSVEIFTVPDLVLKGRSNFNEEDDSNDKEKKKNGSHHHHHTADSTKEAEHRNSHHHGDDRSHHRTENVENHHGRHHLLEKSHTGVKVVDVAHHQMQPAVDGASVSYIVKKEEPRTD